MKKTETVIPGNKKKKMDRGTERDELICLVSRNSMMGPEIPAEEPPDKNHCLIVYINGRILHLCI